MTGQLHTLKLSAEIQPRIIRMRDAPRYCGMDKNRFNSEIRPLIPVEINIGVQGIGFDRLDLDTAIEEYKRRNGRTRGAQKGDSQCQNTQLASKRGAIRGLSTKGLGGTADFAKALALVRSQKLKPT